MFTALKVDYGGYRAGVARQYLLLCTLVKMH